MNRTSWLKEQRREAEEKYDTLWSPTYGEKLGLYHNSTHQEFIQRFLGLLAGPGLILDAACGAGRYEPFLLEAGHRVAGIDQSLGMLGRARSKFPAVSYQKVGLQELAECELYDGAICMDAMENVCPEDWPLVLGNFHRALKSPGLLYFTVEMAPENEVQQAFERAQQAGLPVVWGEWPDAACYHYYPSVAQVREWVEGAGFDLLAEGQDDEYRHLIVKKG